MSAVPVLRPNVPVVDAGAHDGEPGQIEEASQKIRKGVPGEAEEETLAARIEIEIRVQIVMFVLRCLASGCDDPSAS